MDPETAKCDFCKKVVDMLFQCKDCQGDQSGDKDLGRELLCKVCVMPHLQCDHIITDQKGNEVLVCTEHKMMQHEYCRTCDEVFCWGCMFKHSKHEFGSLDTRASELRTKVFESLSELEDKEKLMNASKANFEVKIEKHEEEQKVIREIFEVEVEKIKQTGLKVIDDNCDLMRDHLKAVDDVIVLQQKLRELLSVSNDHLVDQFKTVEKEVEQIQIASEKMKKEEKLRILSCNVDCIVTKLKQLLDSILEDLKSILVDQSYVFWHPDNTTCYKICTDIGKILIENVNFDMCGSLAFTNSKTGEFEEEISRCFSAIHLGDKILMILITSNKSAYVVDPSDPNLKLTSVSYPTMNHFLCPYYVKNQQDILSPRWSYWEGGLIKFTHDASFTVPCETIPSVRMGQCTYWQLIFITSNNTVITTNIYYNRNARVSIPDIDGISCVSRIDNCTLFIFSADGNSCYTADWDQRYTRLSQPVKHNWNNQSNIITVTVNDGNYSVTKASNPPDSQNPYLFKVERV